MKKRPADKKMRRGEQTASGQGLWAIFDIYGDEKMGPYLAKKSSHVRRLEIAFNALAKEKNDWAEKFWLEHIVHHHKQPVGKITRLLPLRNCPSAKKYR